MPSLNRSCMEVLVIGVIRGICIRIPAQPLRQRPAASASSQDFKLYQWHSRNIANPLRIGEDLPGSHIAKVANEPNDGIDAMHHCRRSLSSGTYAGSRNCRVQGSPWKAIRGGRPIWGTSGIPATPALHRRPRALDRRRTLRLGQLVPPDARIGTQPELLGGCHLRRRRGDGLDL